MNYNLFIAYLKRFVNRFISHIIKKANKKTLNFNSMNYDTINKYSVNYNLLKFFPTYKKDGLIAVFNRL